MANRMSNKVPRAETLLTDIAIIRSDAMCASINTELQTALADKRNLAEIMKRAPSATRATELAAKMEEISYLKEDMTAAIERARDVHR